MATGVNDLVLVHVDNKPGFYARIEEIAPDVKPGWWQVALLVLTLPLQEYHWILEEEQINGTPFTMGGTPVRLEKVIAPSVSSRVAPPELDQELEAETKAEEKKGNNVISLFDRKKDT